MALAEDVVRDVLCRVYFAEAVRRARNPAEAKLFTSLKAQAR